MYEYLQGTFIEAGYSANDEAFIVIEVAGIGYKCLTIAKNFQQLPAHHTSCKLYTSFIVREDAQYIVGFFDKGERNCFELLIKANGVGLKSALSLLNTLSVSELTFAMMNGDYKKLTQAKGVGPKLAQKLVIELKDKMTGWRNKQSENDICFASALNSNNVSHINLGSIDASIIMEAETVLLSLGYGYDEITQAIHETADTTITDSSILLQTALKWLTKRQSFSVATRTPA